jgi:hypothetical protein
MRKVWIRSIRGLHFDSHFVQTIHWANHGFCMAVYMCVLYYVHLYVDHLVTLYGSGHIHVHKQTACM